MRRHARARRVVGAVLFMAVGTQAVRAQCEIDKLLASDGSSGDEFGTRVDVSGEVIVVGTYWGNAAYVYRFDGSSWVEEAVLRSADTMPNDAFGAAVAIEGDVIVVGAFLDDDSGRQSGSAYVFRFDPEAVEWVLEDKLLASDGEPSEWFGSSVAISGETLAVGAPGSDQGLLSGAVYIFRLEAGVWTEVTKFQASDTTEGHLFGGSVAIDGDLLVAGALGVDLSSGAAYVFRRDGPSWREEAKLVDADGASGDLFGRSVAISGDAVVVGAYGDFPGSAFVFRGCLGWAQEAQLLPSDLEKNQTFAETVSIDGGVIVIGATGDGQNGPVAGAAHVFRRRETQWIKEAKLLASDGTAYDKFGTSVAVDGDFLVVGAEWEDGNGPDSGSAYVTAGLSGTDCNDSGVPDACDLDAGLSQDADGNRVPDECDCPWDLDGSGLVSFTDFLGLLANWGTWPGGPPDFDGDGVVGIVDFLHLLQHWGPCPLYTDCNGNGLFDLIDVLQGVSQDCNGNGVPDECDTASGSSADCNGNGVPDECDVLACTSSDCNWNGIPDECDVAGGASQDGNDNGVPDECETASDECQDALPVTDGTTPFLTLGASTDGPLTTCAGGPAVPVLNDVWFIYSATCLGTVTFSLCNDADFDAELVIYYAGSCPPPTQVNPLACSDDAAGCGQTPVVQVFAVEGLSFLVRVGSPMGAEGTGILTVSCQPLP